MRFALVVVCTCIEQVVDICWFCACADLFWASSIPKAWLHCAQLWHRCCQDHQWSAFDFVTLPPASLPHVGETLSLLYFLCCVPARQSQKLLDKWFGCWTSHRRFWTATGRDTERTKHEDIGRCHSRTWSAWRFQATAWDALCLFLPCKAQCSIWPCLNFFWELDVILASLLQSLRSCCPRFGRFVATSIVSLAAMG